MASMSRVFHRLFCRKRVCCKIMLLFVAVLESIAIVSYVLVTLPDDNHVNRFSLVNLRRRLPQIDFTVEVKTSKVLSNVDEKFLSVCLSWRDRDLWRFNSTTEKRLIALTKALSPAYLRIGGIPSDFVIFQSPSSPYGKLTVHIGEDDLDRINEIAKNAGWQVLFTLSVARRLENGSWDPSNPFRIVKYVADKGYQFGWELGNGKRKMINRAFVD